ncbi:MAG: phage tail tape measure protein [Desulfobulbus sp.]|nr:phage tail tape measure protein [Desulfobulbus sp.]
MRKNTESEMTRLNSVMSLRNLDISKYGKVWRESRSLGNELKESRARSTELGKQLARTQAAAKYFPSLTADVKRLTTEFNESKRETVALERRWKSSLETSHAMHESFKKGREEHKKNQEAIARHRTELERLSAVEEGRARISAGKTQAKQGLGVIAATAAMVTPSVMKSADYQAIIRDIAIKGGIARTDKEDQMSASIRKDAADSGIGQNELAEAVNTLVAGGMDVADATKQARSMARFAVGQNADSTDTAKLVLALRQAGVTDQTRIEAMLGKVAVAGDLGSFEAKDMAKHFPSLMPQLTAFGMSGEHATVELSNMLQTQMKAAGSADEAAVNLANLLSKLTSADTIKKFDDNGIDFTESMQANIAKGYDPVTAFLGLVQEASVRTDPKKAKQMADLQAQIAKTQDPAAAQKMLDGYLQMAGLSEFITDRQAKQAALAALQNQKLHRENLKTIQTTNGLAKVEKDLADRRDASKQIWSEAGNAWNGVLVSFGDALRPATDLLGQFAGGVARVGSAILGSGFGKTAAVAATTAAVGVGGFKLAKGIGNIAGGALQAFRNRSVLAGGLPGTGGIVSGATGKGGILGRMIGAVTGGNGAPVFVTNWPGGGLGIPGMDGGGLGGPATGKKPGILSNLGKAASGVLGAGRAALAAPTLGAIASGGAGTLAAAGGLVTAAGAAGYGVGTIINDKLIAGTEFGDSIGRSIAKTLAFFGNQDAKDAIAAEEAFKKSEEQSALASVANPPKPAAAEKSGVAKPQQNLTFSPKIDITVHGDVKDPRRLAEELLPHMKRLMDQFTEKSARGDLFDPAHA